MTVERREAQRQSHLARAALARLRGGLDRKSSPKGASQAPWRLPPLHRPVSAGEWSLQSSDAYLRRENDVRCRDSDNKLTQEIVRRRLRRADAI